MSFFEDGSGEVGCGEAVFLVDGRKGGKSFFPGIERESLFVDDEAIESAASHEGDLVWQYISVGSEGFGELELGS